MSEESQTAVAADVSHKPGDPFPSDKRSARQFATSKQWHNRRKKDAQLRRRTASSRRLFRELRRQHGEGIEVLTDDQLRAFGIEPELLEPSDQSRDE